MAQATAHCVCEKCGKAFIKVKTCSNRREANEFEEWAEQNITLCPECYQKQLKEEKEKKMEECLEKNAFSLTTINGVSEKQIQYADTLRKRHIANNIDRVDLVIRLISSIDKIRLESLCKELNKTEKEIIALSMQRNGLYKTYAALYTSEAKDIIETLK